MTRSADFGLPSHKPLLGYRNLIRQPGATVTCSPSLADIDNLLYPDFDEVVDFGSGTNHTVTFELSTVGSSILDEGPRMFILWLPSGVRNSYTAGPRIRVDSNSSFTSPAIDGRMTPFYPSEYPNEDTGHIARPFFAYVDTGPGDAAPFYIELTFDWSLWFWDVIASNFYAGPYIQFDSSFGMTLPQDGGIQYSFIDESTSLLGVNGSAASFGRQVRRAVDINIQPAGASGQSSVDSLIWRNLMMASGSHHDVVWMGDPENLDEGVVHDYTWLGRIKSPNKLSPFSGAYWQYSFSVEEIL